MILAAGRGERLRPLTDTLPKPLIKVGLYTLIEHQIRALHQAGVTEIVINVCYLADLIQQALGDGRRYGVTIHYVVEHELGGLDTGGGILNALSILGNEAFIVVSADIVTDFCYVSLFDKCHSLAYLIMTSNPDYHLQGDFSLMSDGCVSLQSPSLTFAGIAVLQPQLFSGFKLQRLSLRDVLTPAIERGGVYGTCHQGKWYNVGTEAQLRQCQSDKTLLSQ